MNCIITYALTTILVNETILKKHKPPSNLLTKTMKQKRKQWEKKAKRKKEKKKTFLNIVLNVDFPYVQFFHFLLICLNSLKMHEMNHTCIVIIISNIHCFIITI